MGAHYRCPQGVRSRGEEFRQGKYLSGVSGIVYKQIAASMEMRLCRTGIESWALIASPRDSRKTIVTRFTCPAGAGF